MANYDEFFVDIDAPGELSKLLSTGSTTDTSSGTSVPPTPLEKMASDLFLSSLSDHSVSSHGHSADGSCCDNKKDEKEDELQAGPDFGNDRTIGLPRDFANVRRRVKRQRESSEKDSEKDAPMPPTLKRNDPAALWKCVQLPVLDVSGRGIFASLRKYFLEDASIYMIVFNLSTFPSMLSLSAPLVKIWYRESIGIYLDEVYALCKEAYVILVGSFVDCISDSNEIEIKCNAVMQLTNAHRQRRTDQLTNQLTAIERKQQMTMADQEKLTMLRNLLDKQKVRLCDRIVRFSSQIEGSFSSTTLSTLIELLQSGAVQGDAQDVFFKAALEPITNLHSDIIEYIEMLAASMRFPIVNNNTFEDIFFKEYQIISEQIVKRIPKFLHMTGHIFWSLKNDILSDLVVLRPEFVAEFLVALFAFIFDEKPLQSALIGMQEAGRRLYQLGANEVREAAMRFIRTGILDTHIGELFVRKGLNIKSSENLQATLVSSSPNSRNRSNSVGESDDEGFNKAKEGISSAPIHVCVEKFCVGFQMAYVFDSDSLEYTTLFHPRIAEIDMKNPRTVEQTKAPNPGTTTSTVTKPEKPENILLLSNLNAPMKKDANQPPETPKEKKAVSFAPAPLTKKGSVGAINTEPAGNSNSNFAPQSERQNSPTKRSQSPMNKQQGGSLSSVSSDDKSSSTFFLKFSKNAKVVRQVLNSVSSTTTSAGGRAESKSPALMATGGGPGPARAPSITSSTSGSNHRFLLFPALRPPTLPEAYRLAIADAWESLSPEMWIGASLTFPANFYPPSAFHEIITRVRRKVQYLEFGYVWQTGAFGKFINSTNCFVKFLHHTAAPLDCNFDSLLAENDAQRAKSLGDLSSGNENTITFELRTNSDVPSPESAKLNMVAGFMFSEKTLRDYVMNLWERLYEILATIEDYCGSFAALLIERRVRCPFCRKLSFTGEWTSPRELQAFHEKPCPYCSKVVDTAYLVQPKSCQRELCERIMKDIQKRRATTMLANSVIIESEPSGSSDDDNAFRRICEEVGGEDVNVESAPQSRHQSRHSRRSGAGSAASIASAKSKKSARLMADHSELLSMMKSDS